MQFLPYFNFWVAYIENNLFTLPGAMEVVWRNWWSGCQIVGIGNGVSFLGHSGRLENQTTVSLPLIPYIVRTGGGQEWWLDLYTALRSTDKEGTGC